MAFYQRVGTRIFDLFIGVPAPIALSPLLLLLGILMWLDSPGPILFVQQRLAKDGQAFTACEFRTMIGAHDAQGALLPDSQRLTSLGRILRSASLDELPEPLNFIKDEVISVRISPSPLSSLLIANQGR